MAIIYDNIVPLVVPVVLDDVAARTSAGSYASGVRKNMRRKENAVALFVVVSAINTNLLLKFASSATHGGTYADITTGTMVAIPGAGEMGTKGTVSSASGVHTITAAGVYVVELHGKDYKQWLRVLHQTTGGACTYGVHGFAVGPVQEVAS